eukprot:3442920-Pleurochrysis_carterae.AAC.1
MPSRSAVHERRPLTRNIPAAYPTNQCLTDCLADAVHYAVSARVCACARGRVCGGAVHLRECVNALFAQELVSEWDELLAYVPKDELDELQARGTRR